MANKGDREALLKWLAREVERNQAYHNHKERMAWLATTFYTAGIIGLGYNIHVPKIGMDCTIKIIFLVFLLILLTAISCFLCFQFENRWIAAGRVVGLTRTIARLQSGWQPAPDDWTICEKQFYPNFIESEVPQDRKFGLDNGRWRVEWTSYAAMLASTVIAGFLAFCS